MYKQPLGQPVGFLLGQSRPPFPSSPFMNHSSMPFMSHHGMSHLGGLPPQMSPSPFSGIPFGGGLNSPSGPPAGGLGGMLQGLLGGGGGNLDIGSALNSAQKMIGVINQIGPIVKNISPMLQMLKIMNSSSSSDDDDILKDISDTSSNKPKRKRRRKRRYKKKNK